MRDPRLQKLEPKSFLANERTFLTWLQMATTIGGIASALVGYTATTEMVAISTTLSVIPIVLLMIAIVIVIYSIRVFFARAHRISHREQVTIDDPRGPMFLAVVIGMALVVIFAVEAADLVQTVRFDMDRAWEEVGGVGKANPSPPAGNVNVHPAPTIF